MIIDKFKIRPQIYLSNLVNVFPQAVPSSSTHKHIFFSSAGMSLRFFFITRTGDSSESMLSGSSTLSSTLPFSLTLLLVDKSPSLDLSPEAEFCFKWPEFTTQSTNPAIKMYNKTNVWYDMIS